MPMIVSPLFWEWFNIWLVQFLKDLYHEIKMVALRGTNSSLNSLSHACVNHGSQTQQSAIDVAQSLQTSLNMPQSAVAQHINANQINLPLNNVSLQFIPQQANQNSLKHEQSSSRYTNSNCMLPSHHYRLLTQARTECYHPSGATGAGFMPSGTGGAQPTPQPGLRVQQSPQQSAPPAPQQDITKNTMTGHSFVPQQSQTPQTRPQYHNFQFRPSQHGTRPNAHPSRQQQPFIPNAAAAAAAPAPVMYHPLMFPTHMGLPPQPYQQPRSQGFYQYVTPFISYTNPPNHTPPYYYPSNSQQLQTPNLQTNAPGGRNNPTTLMGPQGTAPTPTAPAASLSHPQTPAHMHQTMSGIRPTQTKRSHRLAIIDPVTRQDILTDLYSSNDSQYVSGDSSERQTPQPEPTHSIAEEFSRMVNEVANQPTATCESSIKSSYKNVDLPISSTSPLQPQLNAINSLSINLTKSDTLHVNDTKLLGMEVTPIPNETPIVSAISDSPVIVPKLPMNIKQLQKSSDQIVQPLVVDANKIMSPNKQQNKNKTKPVVPNEDEIYKSTESISSVGFSSTPGASAPLVVAGAPAAPAALAAPAAPASGASAAPIPAASAAPVATAPATAPTSVLAPQPQRIREPRERVKSEEKEKDKNKDREVHPETESILAAKQQLNGPSNLVISSSVDKENINLPTSQVNQTPESTKRHAASVQPVLSEVDSQPHLKNIDVVASKIEPAVQQTPITQVPTATQLLSASIEKLAKELPTVPESIECLEASSAIQAQAKLNQSLASCIRTNQTDPKMKDVNLNNKTIDPDTANGNSTELSKTETVKEDINKNQKLVKNSKNSGKKQSNKMANNEKETESYENGKDETDKVSIVEEDKAMPQKEETSGKTGMTEQQAETPTVFVPKYKYSEDQWSPLNKSGKKCYDIMLLKQIKDDPLSKNKPNAPLLETCNVIRTAPMQEPMAFATISRPMNDSLFPTFLKNAGMGSRNSSLRDAKKDGRNISSSGKSSGKPLTPSGSSSHKQVISISLREDVRLSETENAWKPTRFKKENLTEEDAKTEELYKQFRGILNKLTPQKFDTLIEKVKNLEINNQKRLEGVIDLVFEKAIDEPNFSKAYAAMCNKLSMLKVPADNATTPDQCVNFRALIISKCQNQFVTEKVDEQVMKLEKEIEECTDPVKKKELHLMLNEENRRVRMRSVGNVRFIGELYKLKMLTAKIMMYCMSYLIDKLEEEKLECLCKLLTTIGEQVENEVKDHIEGTFKRMQEIVDRKSNKISSRVRFMLQDVIELRKRKWVTKSVVDSQPKMMDQIQKEAEQQQRHIELMNANPMGGGFRRDDGGRGKRGDGRRQNNNSFMDNSNNWKTSRPNYLVDTSKFKAVTQNQKINSIKLAPQTGLGWTHGSGTKSTAQAGSNSMISLSKNMYSVLENVQTDPASIRSNKDMSPSYHSKGASIERSTFNSRGDFSGPGSSGSKSGSMGVARSNSGSRSTSTTPASAAPATAPPADVAAPPAAVPQDPLPDSKKKSVKSMIDLCLINSDNVELAADVKQLIEPQYHAALITEIVTVAVEKSPKEVSIITKSVLHLVSTNVVSGENFITGIKEFCEFAPDLYIDIPMLYEYLGWFMAPQIEKKHVTFVQVLGLCDAIIGANHGHMLLKAIIKNMKESMGPTFVKSKWQESGLKLNDWMSEEQVEKWLEDNKFEFLEGAKVCEETKKILSPADTQSKLLQLMNSDENCECIRGWVQDNLGKSANEEWFMRALIQAICEHALFVSEARDTPRFNQDRMSKYAGLINDFGELRDQREASCLLGIQQLMHNLEHPQGITLEIFQCLHEQYIISVDGFIAWEESQKELEGKAVMMKALTSFFTNIKEADNEDSCSED
ncbi:eukaryotic translation initiation factor 4G1 isoform X3 [Choristoneura fumiferana]|uniref:eukaryotic translation initiation factor 4G1 isoform X3 n=1 Tax=Choristoneura fumiferana TaxID=7141 RepID=UPI003D1545CC